MGKLHTGIMIALFTFVLGLGMAAFSEAATADPYVIQKQLDAKSMELDRELASDAPNGAKIEKLSRDIGELKGKLLNAGGRVESRYDDRGYYDCGYDRRAYDGYGYHHGRGHRRGGHGCWW